MGLELLEHKYQDYIRRYPEHLPVLAHVSRRAADVQARMRALLDPVTGVYCPDCSAPCCQCLPVEGWFTEGDYFLYRMKYAAPHGLRVEHGLPRGCAFLGPRGCVLPADLRPFPCVKVNCDRIAEALRAQGRLDDFKVLYDALDRLQEDLWPLIRTLQADWFETPPEAGARDMPLP
jgi:hypothetical protein